jgi:cyclopropane fatty-acyl-phospholipid synthase-like methyltransferase
VTDFTADTSVEPVGACPLCESEELITVLEQADVLFPTGRLILRRCDACGLAFLDPRMTFEAMARLEEESETYDFDAERIRSEIDARVGLVETLAVWPRHRRRLLDVGCNRGLLLAAAERLGWNAVGVEISRTAAELARSDFGATVFGRLADVPADDKFDLILAWHVLEHTSHPVAFLTELSGLLEPQGGVLALQVPSYDFVSDFRARGQLGSIVCAVHNFCFTEQAIREASKRAGLDILRLSNSPDDLMLTVIARPADWRNHYRQITSLARRRLRRLVA